MSWPTENLGLIPEAYASVITVSVNDLVPKSRRPSDFHRMYSKTGKSSKKSCVMTIGTSIMIFPTMYCYCRHCGHVTKRHARRNKNCRLPGCPRPTV
jgi:hypothetical protein